MKDTGLLQRLSRLLRNRTFVYGLVLAACLANGIVQTVATYDADLGMGDNSTFYAFARNAVHGEVMYKDFIHFRTPGTITLFAGLMRLLGQDQSTIEIATRLETLVLFPLLFVIASMIFFRKHNPWFVVLAYAGIALIPGVGQLRAGFGLLTVVIYGMSLEAGKWQKRYLLASGFLAAVTFFFGQEIFLMVGLCLAAGELYRLAVGGWKINHAFWLRIKYLATGLAIGLVPLLLYIALFSSLHNFLYYTLYYSFVQQPRFMNLPFPEFSFATLFNYLPFILYWLCFVVLYANKRLGQIEGLLLSFGILRLITATGRSDYGHFLFSIPELFMIVPFFIVQARRLRLDRRTILRGLPFATVLAVLLWAGTKQGIALGAVPFVVLAALYLRSRSHPKTKSVEAEGTLDSYNVYALMAALLFLFVYLLTPTYVAVAKTTKRELFVDDSKAYRIGGVKTDEINYRQIQAVRAAAAPYKPTTVFAFPIQPFYYSLAEHHAARFLTFEPQTTVEEQEQTISDLQRTKPQVIVFDPLQAHGLSGSLWKISNYIMANYRIAKEVNMRENLWVMVPKEQAARNDKLVFQLFHDNSSPDSKSKAMPIQSSRQGLYNAIGELPGSLSFQIDAPHQSKLLVSLRDSSGGSPEVPVCGTVTLGYHNGRSTVMGVCSDIGNLEIPLEADSHPVTIVLKNSSAAQIIWNDVTVKEL